MDPNDPRVKRIGDNPDYIRKKRSSIIDDWTKKKLTEK